jgi:PTH1 family peptidyl-tRNA hydrolase
MPQTFMNASGRAVQMLAGFFKIPPEEILVVHDELDFAPGTARLKQGGGIAGHNGLKDISQRLGTHDYWRLRIGVGRPTGDSGADYVLEKPPAEEREAIEGAVARALEHVPLMLAGDMQGAMQKLHSEDKPVVKKAEAPKPEPKKAEPKKAEPKKAEAKQAPPRQEKAGLLKGLLKGLTGSRK